MAPRSVDATPERWADLGRYVVRKREALEMDQQDLVQAAVEAVLVPIADYSRTRAAGEE